MSGTRYHTIALRSIVAVALVAVLAACTDDDPAPTVDDATAPTTAPAETTVTTSAPTTTETTTTETTETTAAAEEEADLMPVETEEGLTRTFPVSAGWIVDSSDNSVTVGTSVGSTECYGLASAEVEETADEVLVTLSAGFREDATGCDQLGPFWTYEFELSEPLGDRPVVDTHTGLELGTERPDPEEG
ncbi:MAG TPA: hypothetical protein VK011_01900 [Acidimicrobiia bacterium]|nr:hypothetical protein [Acidimicrobiia bacterium]